jgi:hypothetical protein
LNAKAWVLSLTVFNREKYLIFCTKRKSKKTPYSFLDGTSRTEVGLNGDNAVYDANVLHLVGVIPTMVERVVLRCLLEHSVNNTCTFDKTVFSENLSDPKGKGVKSLPRRNKLLANSAEPRLKIDFSNDMSTPRADISTR